MSQILFLQYFNYGEPIYNIQLSIWFQASLMNWRIVFVLTAILTVLKVVIFSIFATSAKQKWAFQRMDEHDDNRTNSESHSHEESAGPLEILL